MSVETLVGSIRYVKPRFPVRNRRGDLRILSLNARLKPPGSLSEPPWEYSTPVHTATASPQVWRPVLTGDLPASQVVLIAGQDDRFQKVHVGRQ